MHGFKVLAALAVMVAVAPAVAGKEKPEQPKARKVCRTVQMSGRITPQRICRKVERSASDEQTRRDEPKPSEPANQAD